VHYSFILSNETHLVALGLNPENLYEVSFDVYKEHFEDPFIKAIERYYRAESNSFLAVNSISEYLKQAEKRLREEEDRGARYFNAETLKPVSKSLTRDVVFP
jgi:cullin 1